MQIEIAFMVMSPWVCYLIAEGFELSGIVAILCNGIVLSQYGKPNLQTQTKKVLQSSYHAIAYGAENLVFIFLGIGLFSFKHPFEEISFGFVLGTMLNFNFARFCNIAVCSYLTNK
jgi:NhaP-type Na+/H+ or K+/H+ antiporter